MNFYNHLIILLHLIVLQVRKARWKGCYSGANGRLTNRGGHRRKWKRRRSASGIQCTWTSRMSGSAIGFRHHQVTTLSTATGSVLFRWLITLTHPTTQSCRRWWTRTTRRQFPGRAAYQPSSVRRRFSTWTMMESWWWRTTRKWQWTNADVGEVGGWVAVIVRTICILFDSTSYHTYSSCIVIPKGCTYIT